MLRQAIAWIIARLVEGVLGAALLVVIFTPHDAVTSLSELYGVMFLVYWFEVFSGYIIFVTVAQIISGAWSLRFPAHVSIYILSYLTAWLVFSLVLFDFTFEIIRLSLFFSVYS